MTGKPSVTGRDGYIMAKALAYAIACIDGLPEERREVSNRCDMVALLFSTPPFPIPLSGKGSRAASRCIPAFCRT